MITTICWSCQNEVITEEVLAADGFCPVCDAEIAGDDSEDEDE